MEMRRIQVPFEVKATADGAKIEGYGSVFGNVDAYGDVVAKGAFTASLAERRGTPIWPKMLYQHDDKMPIGVWTDMEEDEHGLRVVGQLADTQQARDVGALVRMGAISGASIGFMTRADDYDEKTGIRTIKAVDLWEVSLVTFPANEAAQIEARKAQIERFQAEKDYERALRDVGFSHSESKALISGLKGLFATRDEARIEARARELMQDWHAKAIRERIFGKSHTVKG